MKYHLERTGERQEVMFEIWTNEAPQKCICFIPTHHLGLEETTRLAYVILHAINGASYDQPNRCHEG